MRLSLGLVLVSAATVLTASAASAQVIGTFRWQLQPFCNAVTLDVVQQGALYRLDGYDDQCGAAQRAPIVGVATLNPDGSIGFGLHVVTSPGGQAVHVEARIALAQLGGPWSDSVGNQGTLVFNGAAAGAPRPTPGAVAVALGPGAAATTTALWNTAIGRQALLSNTTGESNTAVGSFTVRESVTGSRNTAVGASALSRTTGSSNIAIGYFAGYNVFGNSNNIHLGNAGLAEDNATMRLGAGAQTRTFIAGVRGVTTGNANAIPVLIDSSGQLGTVSSSRRSKQDVADMGEASSRVLQLRPVTFRYTQPMADGSTPLDFGLIAEEVAEVFPELAVAGADGRIETVAYHKLPALLLNELQKQQAVIAAQATAIEELRRRLDALTSDVKR